MPLVTVRIDPQTRKEMSRLREVNWSEELRKAIRSVITERRRVNRARAARLMDELSRPPVEGMDSGRVIREFRERRHGKRGR